jgi:uncharacterized protein
MADCPTCNKPVLPFDENPSFPFCSRRCRLVDLGDWIDERYRIPVQESDAAEDHERPGPPERND